MKKTIRVKPGQKAKTFSRIFSGIFALIGLGFVAIGATEVIPSGAGLFGFVWTGMACVFVMIGIAGAVNKDGLYGLGRDYRIEVDEEQSAASGDAPASVEARLKQLEDLREKRLITAGEYEEKRKDILKEL